MAPRRTPVTLDGHLTASTWCSRCVHRPLPACTLKIADPDGSDITTAYDCGSECFGGDGASFSPTAD